MYAIVLAGGRGSGLRPLSTPDVPEAFLPLLGPRSLLADTVRRLLGGDELPLGPSDITVVAERRHEPLIRAEVPRVGFLAEPAARNTAAAIALAAAHVDRGLDEPMLVLPADHGIARPASFRHCLREAAAVADGADGRGTVTPLVTLGIAPDGPATAYGYLVPAWPPRDRATRLAGYEEKPNRERATELLQVPGVAWNAGVFAWRRDAIIEALQRYAGTAWDVVARPQVDDERYAALPPRSIDCAVLEPAAADRMVAMVRGDVGWSNVATWQALLHALGTRAVADVVPPGESVLLGRNDLLVRRFRRSAWIEAGPAEHRRLSSTVAVLRDAATARPVVEALVARVNRRHEPLSVAPAIARGVA